ncbi:MAG TPA: transposase [Verrucomicrobiota bacterium]|nr:transposase [Verrucomicrobiota bacterium]HNU51430.1 transposase [Verrucomicrobiota bacterium]
MGCVAPFDGKLRLCYLPPYSPELNPDELVWQDLKSVFELEHRVVRVDGRVGCHRCRWTRTGCCWG